ncbi:MAG: hypothetical protein NW241_07820 [Bacteroidia bacterium]|nr:hypothetical protein [Bacteroidia bacterium]
MVSATTPRRSFLGLVAVWSLLPAAAVLWGCGGGEASPDRPPSDLYGAWRLTRLRGGIGAVDMAPGYTETLTFRTDNTASIQRNDAPPVTGPFTSERQQTDVQSQPLLVLTLPGGTKRAILNKTISMLQLTEFNTSEPMIYEYTRQQTP